jgi:putative heme-binding domain-containing protein
MRLTIVSAVLFSIAVCQGQEAKPSPSNTRAVEGGRLTFRIVCSPCHGIHAEGGRGPDLTRGVYTSGDSDKDLFRVIATGVPGTEMAGYSSRLDNDEIAHVIAYIKSVAQPDNGTVPGDTAAGETIFWTKGGCAQCHCVGVNGSSLGPDLTRVGRQRSIAYLRSSILNPDADVTPGYATVTVVTRDGKKIVGLEKNFDNFSAQLIDLSGNYYSFLREDVTSMKLESRSLMPSTYGKLLSNAEINDLLAYLNGLRGDR